MSSIMVIAFIGIVNSNKALKHFEHNYRISLTLSHSLGFNYFKLRRLSLNLRRKSEVTCASTDV
jgi:hypothetical protein